VLVDIWLSYSKGRVILLIGELVIEFVVDYLVVTFVICGKDNGVHPGSIYLNTFATSTLFEMPLH